MRCTMYGAIFCGVHKLHGTSPIVIHNMLIYNTTFQVSMDDVQNLVIYLHEKYMPEATKSGIMKNARMCRILSHRDNESECFSVQFEVENTAQLHKWYSTDGTQLNNEMMKLFKNKVVGFPTMMEVIE